MLSHKNIKNNIASFYLFYFFSSFIFYMPFFAVFFEKTRGLTNNEIVYLFSVFSISMFLFELPTGLIADRFGEKTSLFLGSVLIFLSTLFLTFGSYWYIFFGEVLFAIGRTLHSGANQSLVYNYFEENKQAIQNKFQYKKVLSNCMTLVWSSIASASLLSYYLNTVNHFFPFYATIASTLVLTFITAFLPTVNIKRQGSLFVITKKSFIEIFSNRTLKIWCFIYVILNSFVIVGYQILQPYLNEINLASSKNGLIYFFITIFGILSSKTTPQVKKILKNSYVFVAVLSLLFGLAFINLALSIETLFYIIAVMCLYRFLWGYLTPTLVEAINTSFKENSIRSSVFSVCSLFANFFSFSLLFLFAKLSPSIAVNYFILAIFSIILGLVIGIASLGKKLTITKRETT
ncbi:MAG: MFS transporter [Deltaproteobacteria bacterium]|nr:MFS transporter [Deltaproteobacteria bacterium]